MIRSVLGTNNMQPARNVRIKLVMLVFMLAITPLIAISLDLSIPKLENLKPKWNSIEMAQSLTTTVQIMGNPRRRIEKVIFGVTHISLEWQDIYGNKFTAKFVGGRLYAKEDSGAT